MVETQNVVVICGSLRAQSYNRMIVNTLPQLAPDHMKIIEASGIGAIPLYNADIQQSSGFPEPVMQLAEAISHSDGVIFVTPEYNFSVPGVLKNAIDWVSRLPDKPLAGKPVAIQSAAVGMLGGARGQYHLRQIMVFVEAVVFTKPEVFVSFAKTKVDENKGIVTDEATRNAIAAQLEAFSGFVKRLSAA